MLAVFSKEMKLHENAQRFFRKFLDQKMASEDVRERQREIQSLITEGQIRRQISEANRESDNLDSIMYTQSLLDWETRVGYQKRMQVESYKL